jgi:hypothetical protein
MPKQLQPLIKYFQKMAWEGRELEQRQNRLFVEVDSVLKKMEWELKMPTTQTRPIECARCHKKFRNQWTYASEFAKSLAAELEKNFPNAKNCSLICDDCILQDELNDNPPQRPPV